MTGDQLRMVRERLGLNQAQIGAALAVDERTVRRWESEESRIPGPAVAFFGVAIAYARIKGVPALHKLIGVEMKRPGG